MVGLGRDVQYSLSALRVSQVSYVPRQISRETKDFFARENACEQVAIGLSFTLVGRESGARFFNQTQSEVKQNQSKTRITFDTQLKTALS